MSLFESDTIAALATPAGASALALIRVNGPRCRGLASALHARPGTTLPERRSVFGHYRTVDGRELDQLLWVFSPGPRTATGEDTLELTPHGNPLIVQLILADLFARGCRAAEPGEFTRRAFANGRMELTQAEAVMDLIHARSERALAAAQRQLAGGLGRHLGLLVQQLLNVLAQIEAYIDFPDEDLPPEDKQAVLAETENVLRGTKRLLATHRYGELLRGGLKTVLLGAPNVGKSSLLNALTGRDRALVSSEPGTTRDFLEEALHIGPHLLRLIDTAGLNTSPGAIEQMGIAKTYECLAEADLVLWVADASSPVPSLPAEAQALVRPDNTLLVLNKVDLLPDPPLLGSLIPHLYVSARTGAGIGELREAIVARADALAPALASEEQITINARHADALRRAEAGLRSALAGLRASPPHPTELISADLRDALDALGEIAGRVDHERMLDALFATFCIGK